LARTLTSYTWDRFALAFLLLGLNYLVWFAYDWTSLRQMNLKVPNVQIFRTTSVAFPITNLVALLSFVPGGLGVLEGVLLYLFRPFAGDAQILASMVLFRVFHYLLPVFFAMLLELFRKLKPHQLILTRFSKNSTDS